jgi:hypothetical protein
MSSEHDQAKVDRIAELRDTHPRLAAALLSILEMEKDLAIRRHLTAPPVLVGPTVAAEPVLPATQPATVSKPARKPRKPTDPSPAAAGPEAGQQEEGAAAGKPGRSKGRTGEDG